MAVAPADVNVAAVAPVMVRAPVALLVSVDVPEVVPRSVKLPLPVPTPPRLRLPVAMLTEATPVVPVWAKVNLLVPFVPAPMTSLIVQASAAQVEAAD